LLNDDDSVDISYQSRDGSTSTRRVRLNATVATPRSWIGYQTQPQFSTALLWIDRCEVNDEFNATLGRFATEVRQLKIRKVAIDVRGTPGGDSGIALAILRAFGHAPPSAFSVDVRVSPELNTAQPAFDPKNMFPLLEKVGISNFPPNARNYLLPGSLVLSMLAQRLPPPAPEPTPPVDLYLLIDGGTFSSASLFAILVRDHRLGMLIGEPTGNPPSFNASEIPQEIPALPYFLNLSTARLIRPDVGAGPAETILPDVFIPMTAAALAAGSDPALDYIRAR
jgi:C-terminal processing protease CtpA/Prc